MVQDGTPPQLTISQPAENALLGAATVAVSGTATDPHLLRVRVSGVDAQVSASSWLASGVSLAEGGNTLTVVKLSSSYIPKAVRGLTDINVRTCARMRRGRKPV